MRGVRNLPGSPASGIRFRQNELPGTGGGRDILLFSGLKIGLVVLNVNTYYQYVATGLVIIVAAYVEIFQNPLSAKKKK